MNFLLVGLGNPGIKYLNNRHNVGHMFVDWFKSQKVGKSRVGDINLLKTKVYMNSSGPEVRRLISQSPNLPISTFWIVHDDLDLRLGNFKIQRGVGPKVHNGLSSIDEALGTSDYWRIRIGVDNRDSDYRGSGQDYVLSDFTDEEAQTLAMIFPQILKRLTLVQKNLGKLP